MELKLVWEEGVVRLLLQGFSVSCRVVSLSSGKKT